MYMVNDYIIPTDLSQLPNFGFYTSIYTQPFEGNNIFKYFKRVTKKTFHQKYY